MAKNDWRSSPADIGRRDLLNQPFWLASGNLSGNTITISLSPGSVRYGHTPNVVYSGQAQTLSITNTAASTNYAVFLRAGGTLMVSGYSGGVSAGTVPGPPRWDAELLGVVGRDGSGNLLGPWNQGTFDQFEQRGQYTAPTRPRVVYDRFVDSPITIRGTHTGITTASGILWIHLDDSRILAVSEGTPSLVKCVPATLLQATVEWMISGQINPSQLRHTVGFAIQRTQDLGGSTAFGRVHDTYCGDANADPFNDAVTIAQVVALVDVNAVAAPSVGGGYVLVAWSQATNNDDAFLVRRAYFTVQPGAYASRQTESS